MRHTITAMFDNYQDASEAVTRLKTAGIPESDISIISNDPAQRDTTGSEYHPVDDDSHAGTGAGGGAAVGGMLGGGAGMLAGLGLLAIPGLGPVVAAGWLAATLVGAGAGAVAGGLVGSLIGAGIPEEDAHLYAEGIRRGGTLVTVRADDDQHARVTDILDDEGTIEINERANAWRNEGWDGRYQSGATPGSTSATPTPTTAATAATATPAGRQPSTAQPTMPPRRAAAAQPGASPAMSRPGERNESIPIVEENVHVGKRDVSQGRVRVRSYVVENPVQEQVNLRREHVEVERRPVDRPAGGGEAFRDRTIEAEERAEEPVVSKDARVKEEVAVRKTADQRTETVRDTARRTEVEIEDNRNRDRQTGTGKDRRS